MSSAIADDVHERGGVARRAHDDRAAGAASTTSPGPGRTASPSTSRPPAPPPLAAADPRGRHGGRGRRSTRRRRRAIARAARRQPALHERQPGLGRPVVHPVVARSARDRALLAGRRRASRSTAASARRRSPTARGRAPTAGRRLRDLLRVRPRRRVPRPRARRAAGRPRGRERPTTPRFGRCPRAGGARRRTAAPTPRSGCVLVRDGRSSARDFTCGRAPGTPRRGARRGRRPRAARRPTSASSRAPRRAHAPCADALIAAGVTRVVGGRWTRTVRWTGPGSRGCARRASRSAWPTGASASRARRQNAGFRTAVSPADRTSRTRRRSRSTAAPPRHGGRALDLVAGEPARVHEWRAGAAPSLVGIGTAIADDPTLTARDSVPPAERQPLRVVVDRVRGCRPARAPCSRSGGAVLVMARRRGAGRPPASRRAGESRPPRSPRSARGGSTCCARAARRWRARCCDDGLIDRWRCSSRRVVLRRSAAPGCSALGASAADGPALPSPVPEWARISFSTLLRCATPDPCSPASSRRSEPSPRSTTTRGIDPPHQPPPAPRRLRIGDSVVDRRLLPDGARSTRRSRSRRCTRRSAQHARRPRRRATGSTSSGAARGRAARRPRRAGPRRRGRGRSPSARRTASAVWCVRAARRPPALRRREGSIARRRRHPDGGGLDGDGFEVCSSHTPARPRPSGASRRAAREPRDRLIGKYVERLARLPADR